MLRRNEYAKGIWSELVTQSPAFSNAWTTWYNREIYEAGKKVDYEEAKAQFLGLLAADLRSAD